MHSEAAWSMVNTRPVILYSRGVDGYIAYWCGVGMTHRQALSIAAEIYLGIWATPQMKKSMWDEFVKIYHAGGFQTRDWDGALSNMTYRLMPGSLYDVAGESHYGFLKNRILHKLGSPIKIPDDPREVLQWFDYSRAIQVE